MADVKTEFEVARDGEVMKTFGDHEAAKEHFQMLEAQDDYRVDLTIYKVVTKRTLDDGVRRDKVRFGPRGVRKG